jgi:lysyl-tRNA synthetase class 1
MNDSAAPAPSHWADDIAGAVAGRGGTPVLSTGISPSGEIHIGNMREVLTADAIYRALGDRGVEARFNFVSDDFDPLRKVYPFLDPEAYAPRVGMPLSEIPCPCGDHASYADHFLEPFLDSLRRLRIEVEVVRASEMYRSGRMNARIVEALDRRDRIVEILHELTGKQMGRDWSPFTPRCGACGKIAGTTVRGYSATAETVDVACACGEETTVPMAGGGKLVWRIDWPARWKTLGVTLEPFGKDHSTRGGSYDTGVRIAREVFDIEPPHPVAYEWIRLKGRGDMSSSKGNVLSIASMLEVVPPEVLRYLVLRERPQKTIAFDPGLPLLQLVDLVDAATAASRDERALELSRAGGFEPVGVPFRHLVVVAQAARFDLDTIVDVLGRTGYEGVDREAIASRMSFVRTWLDRFAPEDVRFEVQPDLPPEARTLDSTQRAFLGRLANALEGETWEDDAALHDEIYAIAGQFDGVAPRALFPAIYLALLGKPRGPRAAAFIRVLGAGFCAGRFRAAAAGAEA